MAAPKNNTSAQKGDKPASSHLHLRCTPRQKAGWVKAAQRAGLKLTEWVIARLDGKL